MHVECLLRRLVFGVDSIFGIQRWLRGEGKGRRNIRGNHAVEYGWVIAQLPKSPGRVLDVGCVHSPLPALCVQLGHLVTGLDILPIDFCYPNFTFVRGDINSVELPDEGYDCVVLCSTVEHVGLSGRFGSREDVDGDLKAMARARGLVKSTGRVILTIPVGLDAVLSPFHRIYGESRLALLLQGFEIRACEFWVKDGENRWVMASRERALSERGSVTYYALGLFSLERKRGFSTRGGQNASSRCARFFCHDGPKGRPASRMARAAEIPPAEPKVESVPLSIIILSLNEEANIGPALESIGGWSDDVHVVDAGSSDRTVEIAKSFGAAVHYHPWVNWMVQRNWALRNIKFKREWVMFLDADERLTPEFKDEVARLLSRPVEYSAFRIQFRYYFMGSLLRFSGHPPNIRIMKPHLAEYIIQGARDYCVPSGKVGLVRSPVRHEDLKGLTVWTEKQNRNATFEAEEYVNRRERLLAVVRERKYRIWNREAIWARLPLFFRPMVYFLYRYFVEGGFLDGKAGFAYAFLHGFWYHFLIDAKIYELMRTRERGISVK